MQYEQQTETNRPIILWRLIYISTRIDLVMLRKSRWLLILLQKVRVDLFHSFLIVFIITVVQVILCCSHQTQQQRWFWSEGYWTLHPSISSSTNVPLSNKSNDPALRPPIPRSCVVLVVGWIYPIHLSIDLTISINNQWSNQSINQSNKTSNMFVYTLI